MTLAIEVTDEDDKDDEHEHEHEHVWWSKLSSGKSYLVIKVIL